MLASNESPDPPLRQVVDAASRAMAGANRYPDPSNSTLKRALSGRYGVPGEPDRDRQRLVRHPARRRRGAARARRRARLRVAVVQRLPAPRGRLGRARRSRSTLDAEHRHDLDAMAQEITVATRLVIVCNPNNPTSTALPFADIAAFAEKVPAPRRADRRRGVLRVQPARRSRHDARPARPPSRTSSCCARSPRSTGSAGCASASRCAARRTSRAPSTRCASRSSATSPRRPPRSRRSSTRTRSPSASSGRSSRAWRSRRG